MNQLLHDSIFIVHEYSGVEYRSPRQIALQLAKQYPTILVTAPTRWLQFKKLSLKCRVQKESDGLEVYSPYELPRRWKSSAITDGLNSMRWRRELRTLVCQFPYKIVFFDRPSQEKRVGLLSEQITVYYAHCDYTVDIVGNIDEKVAQLEKRMLAKVDVVFAASKILVDEFSAYNPNVFHLPCAYNSDVFDSSRSYPTPDELKSITHPIIGFSGYISGRVDFVGVLTTARERPDWSFVLLGNISGAIESELRTSGRDSQLFGDLLALPNVYHLGAKPLAQVPAYVRGFDVCLIPYCLSRFTLTSSPIKAYEYYAMGKPIVSTRVPDVVDFSNDIHFVNEAESYADAIQLALKEVDDTTLIQMRIQAASQQTTAARAQRVVDVLVKKLDELEK